MKSNLFPIEPMEVVDSVQDEFDKSKWDLFPHAVLKDLFCMILKLHQTTTLKLRQTNLNLFCMILKLHQTTTIGFNIRFFVAFCMILKLHQTTTHCLSFPGLCCFV